MPGHRTFRFLLVLAVAVASEAAAQVRANKGKPRTAPPAAPQTAAKPAARAPQGPRLAIEPRGASGGSLVRVTIDGMRPADDSVVNAVGDMAGEPLHFIGAGMGRLQALGAVPLGISDSLVARVFVSRISGVVDTLRLLLKYPHRAAPAPAPAVRRGGIRAPGARLRVDARFTQRLDTATEARVERENQLARDVGRRAQETPPLWTFPFLRPRDTRVTSRFGTGRVFNGRVSSSHLGVDYRGSVGEPILAANRGVVAVVAEFFLAGNVVYVDHGGGLVTGYFHMSQPLVAVGDTVERGQEIGLVGSTGRVTGPHLHWSARFGALTIDPADLLDLRAPFTRPDTLRKKPASARTPAP